MPQKQMRCQIKAEILLFPTMYKSQEVTFPTCSGFCGSGSQMYLLNPTLALPSTLSAHAEATRKSETEMPVNITLIIISQIISWPTLVYIYENS